MFLVGLPLLTGIVFVLLLYCGLSDANRRFQHELVLKDAMIADDFITRKIFSARICAVSYYITNDPFFEETYSENMADAAAYFKSLQRLLKNERGLQTQIAMLRDEIVSNSRGYYLIMHAPIQVNLSDVFGMFGNTGVGKFFSNRPVFSFMDKLQKLSNNEANAVIASMNTLQLIFVGSIVTGTLISVSLALFFCLNISNRLLMIVNNTIMLSRGAELNPPLKGDDEIAELDQFLYKSANEIRELERFKKEMIGVVSHELKSPLSSIAAFLLSLDSGVYGEISRKTRIKVEKTQESVNRLMGLVRELLYLDRLELEMNPDELSVDALVNASIDSVRELALQSGIELVVNCRPGCIYADHNRLLQVIVNLLSNAMKFSPPGGKVRLVAGINDKQFFECRVSDQGRGIPEEFARHIFEPFKQLDANDETAKKGTGLGLAISRSIVEQHGGEIGVDSVIGKGSSFWFKIPAFGNKVFDKSDINSQKNLEKRQRAQPVNKAAPAATQGRRFSVLRKGLVIVSVPLVFQIGFSSLIGQMFSQVREQMFRETRSKEIVETMNHMAGTLVLAANDGVMYVYTQESTSLKSWKSGKQAAFRLFARVKELAASDAGQKQNLEEVGVWLRQISNLLDRMVSLNRDAELGSLENLRAFIAKNDIASKVKPLFAGQEKEELLINSERSLGKKLAAERLKMIGRIDFALWIAVVLNIAISVLLTVFLMKNLSNRLKHVMENTGRLLERKELSLPMKGDDEIAYLDQVLFDTGNRLLELEKFKRELISIVSHELRTPLLSISAVLELFASGATGELSEKGMNRLSFTREECDRLIRLINDLLHIEKMEAGKFLLDTQKVSLEELLDGSIKSVTQLAEARHIKIEASIVGKEREFVADRDRICQVLINLLSNAIKYSPESETIQITVESKNSCFEFRVVDKGRGIADELREKIFERFVQVDEADASKKGGTGLGLAIAKAIVEQHGGQIGVDSETGKGSSFWFRLPLRPGSGEPA